MNPYALSGLPKLKMSKGTCCGICAKWAMCLGTHSCHQSVEKKDAHECYNGCWEHHCPTCGKFGHYKTCEKDTPAPDWREELKQIKWYPNIEPFVEQIIARTQHQTTKKIIEEIEGMKNDVRPEIRVWLRGNRETNEAENALIERVLTKLRANLPQEK